MNETFCPETFWNYNYCNNTEINDKILAGIKIKGKITEELENLYSTYLKSAVHPSLLKVAQKLDEEDELEKEKEKQNIIQKKETERKLATSKKIITLDENKASMNIVKEDDEEKVNEEQEEIEEKVIKEIIFNSIRIDQNKIFISYSS